MSGHDIADEPHETTHEMVIDCVRGGVDGHAASSTGCVKYEAGWCPPASCALDTSMGDARTPAAGIKPGPLTQSIAVQWVRWPNVKPREAAERRSGPRNNWSTTR